LVVCAIGGQFNEQFDVWRCNVLGCVGVDSFSRLYTTHSNLPLLLLPFMHSYKNSINGGSVYGQYVLILEW